MPKKRGGYKRVTGVFAHQSKYSGKGGGTYEFQLECGHTITEKQSEGIPQKKRCLKCKE